MAGTRTDGAGEHTRERSRALVRRAVVWIHRWIGLGMALVLIIEGLTGSLLVYKGAITRWLAPEGYSQAPYPNAPTLDLATLAEDAERLLAPKAAVAYFFDSASGQVALRCRALTDPTTGKLYPLERDWITLDPWTGRELLPTNKGNAAQRFRAGLMPFIDELHISLALGTAGVWILGVVALLWTLDCFGGLYLTMPRAGAGFWRRWKVSWKFKWPTGFVRSQFDLHRAGGLWFWALLWVFAWSSVHLTLPQVYDPITHALFDYVDGDQFIGALPQRPEEHPALGWRAAQASGDRLIAGFARAEHFNVVKPMMIAYFPENGLYSYSVQTDRHFPQYAEFNVFLDADSGALYRVDRAADEHAGNTATNWLRALHFVHDPVDHWTYRVLVFVVGLVLTLLSVTGVYLWWKKRWARRHIRARRAHKRPDGEQVGSVS